MLALRFGVGHDLVDALAVFTDLALLSEPVEEPRTPERNDHIHQYSQSDGVENVPHHEDHALFPSYLRKSSVAAKAPKSSSALMRLPPSGSPSRSFWMLPSPQAMPLFPFTENA